MLVLPNCQMLLLTFTYLNIKIVFILKELEIENLKIKID